MSEKIDKILRDSLTGLTDDAQIDAIFASPDTDMFSLGLDSMRAFGFFDNLAAAGYDIDFGDFLRNPTLVWLRAQIAGAA